ncbi:hypothetical protein ACHAWF_014420, partial [Thalassiosira exigua]
MASAAPPSAGAGAGGGPPPSAPSLSSSPSSSPSSDLLPLRAALRSWTDFDLDARRPHLDASAQSLVEARESGAKARKRLGELTKSLKRAVKIAEGDAAPSNVSTLAQECRSTVKSYQEEIDALARRCKSAEGTFVTLYGAMCERPDPAGCLDEAVRLVEGRDGQLVNLLGGMEALNGEVEREREERERLERMLEEVREELEEARREGGGGEGGGEGDPLSLAEREELIKLRGEVAEYEVEFRGLKNQDITIRKLESKIEELEEDREESIQKELKKARDELAESEGRRATEALEREASAIRKVESLALQLRAERAGREASAERLLRAEDGLGEREAAWEAQRSILVGDAERCREELAEVRGERDAWRLRAEAVTGGGGGGRGGGGGAAGDAVPPPPPMSGSGPKLAAYEAEIGELTSTCAALREELRGREERGAEERESLRAAIDALERERASLSNQVSSLQLRAANAPSQDAVDKMRHELRVLKRLEYNALDLDRDPDHAHPERTPPAVGDQEDDGLEAVLVAKLRKVEAELVRERREKGEGNRARDDLARRLASVQESLRSSEDLVAKLEDDLQLAVASPPTPTAGGGARGGPGGPPYGAPYGSSPDPDALRSVLDPEAPPIVSNPLPPPAAAEASAAAAAEKARDDRSVATIVLAQRDRLRARCDAVEAERDGFKRELQAQVSASESLKVDNAKLYEKVKYLQSFGGGGGGGRGGGGGGGSAYARGGSGGRGSDRDLDLEALERRHKASVDPFRQFSRAERQRKF